MLLLCELASGLVCKSAFGTTIWLTLTTGSTAKKVR